jgi:diaminohydroxyphosphoribosylaminopyrimidine deaminase/5-amino-6-(5-phosphoribosylamino)uracil reductase
MGITIIDTPDRDGRVDLLKLMKELAELKIDSILLEGGGTLNDAMIRADLVNEIKAFVAPKIFGGAGAASPVTGTGVTLPSEAARFTLKDMRLCGEDVLLEYVRKAE